MSQNSNLFLSIGKPIKDEYGQTIGKIASFALTPSGKFDSVFIEFSNGHFSKQSMDHLRFNGAEVTYISKIKTQASILCSQIPLIWRKNQALEDLQEKGKISPALYKEIQKNFDGVLTQLKNDAKILIEKSDTEVVQCEKEMSALSYAVVNLELEHEIGQIDEDSYRSAFEMLQENLKRVSSRKNDILKTKSELSNLLLGESNNNETINDPETISIETPDLYETESADDEISSNETTDLPEPPVVVYVKEIGKAGI